MRLPANDVNDALPLGIKQVLEGDLQAVAFVDAQKTKGRGRLSGRSMALPGPSGRLASAGTTSWRSAYSMPAGTKASNRLST